YAFGCHAITFLQRVFLPNFSTTLFGGAGRNRWSAHFAALCPGPKFEPTSAARPQHQTVHYISNGSMQAIGAVSARQAAPAGDHAPARPACARIMRKNERFA